MKCDGCKRKMLEHAALARMHIDAMLPDVDALGVSDGATRDMVGYLIEARNYLGILVKAHEDGK